LILSSIFFILLVANKELQNGTRLFEDFIFYFILAFFTLGYFWGATGFSGERERKTYDIYALLPYPEGWLVFSKFLALVIALMLLLFSVLPLFVLLYLLGGITGRDLYGIALMSFLTGVYGAGAGVLVSVLFHRTRDAMLFALLFAVPVVFFWLVIIGLASEASNNLLFVDTIDLFRYRLTSNWNLTSRFFWISINPLWWAIAVWLTTPLWMVAVATEYLKPVARKSFLWVRLWLGVLLVLMAGGWLMVERYPTDSYFYFWGLESSANLIAAGSILACFVMVPLFYPRHREALPFWLTFRNLIGDVFLFTLPSLLTAIYTYRAFQVLAKVSQPENIKMRLMEVQASFLLVLLVALSVLLAHLTSHFWKRWFRSSPVYLSAGYISVLMLTLPGLAIAYLGKFPPKWWVGLTPITPLYLYGRISHPESLILLKSSIAFTGAGIFVFFLLNTVFHRQWVRLAGILLFLTLLTSRAFAGYLVRSVHYFAPKDGRQFGVLIDLNAPGAPPSSRISMICYSSFYSDVKKIIVEAEYLLKPGMKQVFLFNPPVEEKESCESGWTYRVLAGKQETVDEIQFTDPRISREVKKISYITNSSSAEWFTARGYSRDFLIYEPVFAPLLHSGLPVYLHGEISEETCSWAMPYVASGGRMVVVGPEPERVCGLPITGKALRRWGLGEIRFLPESVGPSLEEYLGWLNVSPRLENERLSKVHDILLVRRHLSLGLTFLLLAIQGLLLGFLYLPRFRRVSQSWVLIFSGTAISLAFLTIPYLGYSRPAELHLQQLFTLPSVQTSEGATVSLSDFFKSIQSPHSREEWEVDGKVWVISGQSGNFALKFPPGVQAHIPSGSDYWVENEDGTHSQRFLRLVGPMANSLPLRGWVKPLAPIHVKALWRDDRLKVEIQAPEGVSIENPAVQYDYLSIPIPLRSPSEASGEIVPSSSLDPRAWKKWPIREQVILTPSDFPTVVFKTNLASIVQPEGWKGPIFSESFIAIPILGGPAGKFILQSHLGSSEEVPLQASAYFPVLEGYQKLALSSVEFAFWLKKKDLPSPPAPLHLLIYDFTSQRYLSYELQATVIGGREKQVQVTLSAPILESIISRHSGEIRIRVEPDSYVLPGGSVTLRGAREG